MNCKPGDLAVIVTAINPANVGRIVEVVKRVANGEKRKCALGNWVWVSVDHGDIVWLVRCASKIACLNLKAKTGEEVHYGDHEAWISDSKLRPISGVPVTDDINDEVSA